MMSQGWQRKIFYLFVISALTGTSVFASSMTVREINLKGNNEIEIQFDTPVSKRVLEFDFVRDIAQLSIQNATIYPARILHADKQTFNKVFAYQYAPSLVRVRFSVEGLATRFQGKIVTQVQGNRLTVRFPAVAAALVSEKQEKAEKPAEKRDSEEKALLAKIEKSEKSEKAEKSESADKEEKSEKKPLTGKKTQPSLGGAQPGPSAFRSLFAMVLIVGGLGAVLFWVKRKKNAQATRVGQNWWSNLLPQGMRKQKSPIEVIAQHALGPKQSITVVRIRGQQFVLGVTQDSVQLISQIDAEESEVDLLEDPAVAASLGKMFGSSPQKAEPPSKQSLSATFASLLKSAPEAPVKLKQPLADQAAGATAPNTRSATAAIGQRQYAQAQPAAPARPVSASSSLPNSGIRDQIRKRLEGARS